MRTGLRFGIGAALSLAMFAGDLPSASFSAAPAFAHDRYRGGFGGFRGGYRGRYYGGYGHRYYRGGGFDFGDALLGAAIIGGTAAIISSANRPAYDGGYAYQTYPAPPPPPPASYAPGYAPPPPDAYGDDGYAEDGAPPQYGAADPVEQCSRAAEREAQSRGGFARVIGIDKVDGRPNGAHVRGTLEITSGQDRNGNPSRTDRTGFVCTADYGQITGLRVG